MRRLVAISAWIALATAGWGGEYNSVLNIGSPAPAWRDLPGVDGRKHSLDDLKGKKIVVVVFTCNSCPAAEAYEGRIKDFVRHHAGPESDIALVAINVNRIPEDRLDKMIERAAERQFNFPYLYDESQKIARAYGATYTPEFFVLDQERRVAYMGAMDDRSPPAQPTKNYLVDAVESVRRQQKPAVAETLARGCKIRYVRER
ncbi:MAG: thioredoxin family protein [Gemmataceae bacterium]|nr:thioredoxin family protein [Gemmataceae bacterium]